LQIRQRGSNSRKEGANKSSCSNRKSSEKKEPVVRAFQEEYYSSKEDRKERKMKVTLKDIKKQRRSIH